MKIVRVSFREPEPSREVLTLFDDAKEELYGKFLRHPVAQIPDLDSDPRKFHMHVIATRQLGTAMTLLRRILKHHGVAERVTIERLDRKQMRFSKPTRRLHLAAACAFRSRL